MAWLVALLGYILGSVPTGYIAGHLLKGEDIRFIGFRGGRGEATTIGVLLALVTQPMLIMAGPALATLLIKKNVIIASCVLFIPLPLVCWGLGIPGVLLTYSVALPCLVGVTHYFRTRQVARPSGVGSA